MQSCNMKGLKEHIIRWLPAMLGLLFQASCQEDGPMPAPPVDGQQLNLVLRVPYNAPAEGYEEGNMYENYINMSSDGYRIYFFDANNNTFIARFEAADVVPVEGTDYVDYTLLGKVPDELVSHSDFKIVILANWPEYKDDALTTETTTIENICNADWAQFDCLTDFNLGPDNLIPFYGVHTYKDVTFKPGVATLLDEPITLLRAMAKVEVILENYEVNTEVSFSGVSICRYNQKGYCAPANVFSEKDYGQGTNWETDYLPSLHLVGNVNDADAEGRTKPFLKVAERNEATHQKELWIAYLPEYDNQKDDYSYMEVKLSHQMEKDKAYQIYFAEYDQGTVLPDNRYDIARNNLYRFTVTLKNGAIKAEVNEWDYLYENEFIF